MQIKQLLSEQEGILLDLYRGTEWSGAREEGATAVMQIRQDRRPRDASGVFSILFDMGIERKFGIANVRRRSAFCTTGISGAAYYAEQLDDGVIVQMELAPNAKILFNPEVADSLDLASQINYDWYDYMTKFTNAIDTRPMKNLYLRMSPEEAFHEIAKTSGMPAENMDELMQLAQTSADQLVSGYQMVTAGTFKSPSNDMECLVTGVTEYVGHLIPMDQSFFD